MTKPTRLQEQACERLADALLLIAEGARMDGNKGQFDAMAYEQACRLVARASSVFDLDHIVARALERRARGLGVRGSAAELLTLMESDVKPIAMLLLSDEAFRETVENLERELGEV